MYNVIDEVLASQPKYKITHADTTTEIVEIELDTDVTTEGTPINKALFDSIKGYIDLTNVYNTPTINSSATLQTGNYIPSMSSATSGFEVTSDVDSKKYNPINTSASDYWSFTMTANSINRWTIKLDTEIIPSKIKINTSIPNLSAWVSAKLQGSIDGTNFFDITTIYDGTGSGISGDHDYTNPSNKTVRYLRVLYENNTSSSASNSITMPSFQVTEWYTTTSTNDYYLSNHITTLENGQRVALQIPSTYVGGFIKLDICGTGSKLVSITNGHVLTASERLRLVYDGTNYVLDE